MRACIIGGGLAGSLLAWRLAQASQGWQIDLVLGTRSRADATAASGGAVRAYETNPEQRRLATASMLELLGSQTLRQWSRYHRLGSVYLRATEVVAATTAGPGIEDELADIDALLPGSCRVTTGAELRALGWNVPAGATAVLEHHAGYISPSQLRDSVLSDEVVLRRVRMVAGSVSAITPRADGCVRCTVAEPGHATMIRDYDIVVVATGAWTRSLLHANGLPAGDYRTKSIQYSLYRADGWRPPHFVDETTGLYGRPGAGGELLLGLPTGQWDVDPDDPPMTAPLHDRAAHLARERFPQLRLGPAIHRVGSADCYADQPVLALRPVLATTQVSPGSAARADVRHRLFTFSGGAGGSVKTALAASHRAAIQLVESAPTPPPPVGQRKGHTMIETETAIEHDAVAEPPSYHTVGIGAGPANLSLAALFASATTEQIALFDRQTGPSWHNRLLHHGVRMQTSWLKDLVSMVDPRHELTFLNYLVTTGRLYALLNSQFDVMPRLEYVRYLEWAASKLPNISYGVDIDEITFGDGGFVVLSKGRALARSEHLVIGVGSAPVIPSALSGLPPRQAFIADDLSERLPEMLAEKDQPVAIVGGGQTGIEAALKLLNLGFTNIKWLGRRLWFDTIDDSPAANDVYRPAHVLSLQRLSPHTRRTTIEALNPTGHALTPGAMRGLYQANYDAMLQIGHFPVTLFPARDVVASSARGDHILLSCRTLGEQEEFLARRVVIATGRANVPVPFGAELRQRVETNEDGELAVEADFSVRWKGMNGHQIYALNRARFTHGLTDANLTLLPVRAATVLNSMFGREIFPIRDELCAVNWAPIAPGTELALGTHTNGSTNASNNGTPAAPAVPRIDYDGRRFRSAPGESGLSTLAGEPGVPLVADLDDLADTGVGHYHQDGDLVWAEFSGPSVRTGRLVGTCQPDGTIEAAYCFVTAAGENVAGSCQSVPELLTDGRVRLTEHWHRIDGSTGVSVVEEIVA